MIELPSYMQKFLLSVWIKLAHDNRIQQTLHILQHPVKFLKDRKP